MEEVHEDVRFCAFMSILNMKAQNMYMYVSYIVSHYIIMVEGLLN